MAVGSVEESLDEFEEHPVVEPMIQISFKPNLQSGVSCPVVEGLLVCVIIIEDVVSVYVPPSAAEGLCFLEPIEPVGNVGVEIVLVGLDILSVAGLGFVDFVGLSAAGSAGHAPYSLASQGLKTWSKKRGMAYGVGPESVLEYVH
jgi:hypothetical protein